MRYYSNIACELSVDNVERLCNGWPCVQNGLGDWSIDNIAEEVVHLF